MALENTSALDLERAEKIREQEALTVATALGAWRELREACPQSVINLQANAGGWRSSAEIQFQIMMPPAIEAAREVLALFGRLGALRFASSAISVHVFFEHRGFRVCICLDEEDVAPVALAYGVALLLCARTFEPAEAA